jgi:hypothetical protein
MVVLAARRLVAVGRGSRVPVVVQASIGIALAAASLDPGLVTPLRDLLGIPDEPPGRLVVLAVVAVATVYPIVFFAIGRADRAGRRIHELVRALAVAGAGRPPFEVMPADILVCIPAFDEADNLLLVLEKVPRTVLGRTVHVLVVDDGSDDSTSAVAAGSGAWVARHPLRLGGGGALMTATQLAASVRPAIVVTMDGDGQHDPAELVRLVTPIVDGTADFVLGSRRLGTAEAGSRVRDHGISVFTRLINLLGRTRLSDVSNGYRAIRADRLAELALREERFPNPELLFAVSRAGFRVNEVPVTIRRRASGTTKKGSNLRYGLGFFRVLFRSWLG